MKTGEIKWYFTEDDGPPPWILSDPRCLLRQKNFPVRIGTCERVNTARIEIMGLPPGYPPYIWSVQLVSRESDYRGITAVPFLDVNEYSPIELIDRKDEDLVTNKKRRAYKVGEKFLAEIETTKDSDNAGIFHWARFRLHPEICTTGETSKEARFKLEEHAIDLHRILASGGGLSADLQCQLDFLNKIFENKKEAR